MSKLSKCRFFSYALLLYSFLSVAGAQEVTARITANVTSIAPNNSFIILIRFDMAPSWYLYWKDTYNPEVVPKATWTAPKGFHIQELPLPPPEHISIGGSSINGYSDTLPLLFSVTPPQSIPGTSATFVADVSWVACSTHCVPGNATLSLTLPVEAVAKENPESAAAIATVQKMLPRSGASVQEKDGKLYIQIDDVSVDQSDVKNVSFFTDNEGYFDSTHGLRWNINQSKQLQVEGVPVHNGVLVVDETSSHRLAWNISLQVNPTFSIKERQQRNTQHIEALEKEVWYRKVIHLFEDTSASFTMILILAFFGGLLLNIMPCVLPVIALKIFQLTKMSEFSRKDVAIHGFFYALGILVSFWALAGIMFILQASGKIVGWGFQLQEPLFVAALIFLLFAFALSLFNVYEFGAGVAAQAASLEYAVSGVAQERSGSLVASFIGGVFATLIASPCTGPLLGSSLGFAISLSMPRAFLLFTVVGIGMALPYLLLAIFPAMTRLVPKPGRWMQSFKHLMGFFLIATILWLLWVLKAEIPSLGFLQILTALFVVAVGLWIFGNWGSLERSKRVRAFGQMVAFIVIVAGAWCFFETVYKEKKSTTARPIEKKSAWEPFSLERLQELREEHIPVFVEVTARWCLTCQAGKLVLDNSEIQAAFKEHGVVLMRADWTNGNPKITTFLRSLGRNGVPVYALYGKDPDKPPLLLPEILTNETVLDSLNTIDQ